NEVEVMNIIGNAEGRNILIVDDLIDTAGTFCNAVKTLKAAGANDIYGACTHAMLSGNAISRIETTEISKIYITDSIPMDTKIKATNKIEVLSVAELFSEAIMRAYNDKSISSLFDVDKG
ncbi:MAG: ribose-phosphate diphosphokinase, partial [Ignavibacteriales bacterium]|nr:ribose-phosphate diphosphokinase [Ignavibacteriales bacterium]